MFILKNKLKVKTGKRNGSKRLSSDAFPNWSLGRSEEDVHFKK